MSNAEARTKERYPGVSAWPVADGWMIARLDRFEAASDKKKVFVPGITLSRADTIQKAWELSEI